MFVSLQDSFNLFSKITASRFFNVLRIWQSYRLAQRTGTIAMKGFPFSVSVEPTTACNLRCPECPSGLRSFTRPTGRMSTELFSSVLGQLAGRLLYMLFYFQGEPYLHPQLVQMVQMANKRNIYTATSTNAHFLNEANARATIESGLSRLIISIDGAQQDTYASYRKNGSLEEVLAGTQRILKWKKRLKSRTPEVVWQFLVVRPNEHEIPVIRQMAKNIGVKNVAFKTAQIYNYANGHPLIPSQDRYSRYKQKPDGSYVIKNDWPDGCWKMWHSCVITWDGQVVPCCFDKDAKYPMGTLTENSFEDIWYGNSYQKFRQRLFTERAAIDICRNCTEGMKTWA